MKICIISNFYPPFFFGGERAIQREAEGLVRKGHGVSVVTSSPNRKAYTEVINGVDVNRIVPFNLYPPYQFRSKPAIIKPLFHLLDTWNPYSSRQIKNTLSRIKPDIVYIHNFKGLSLGVFSAIKSLKLPSYMCVNDYSLICPRADLLRSTSKICTKPPLACRIYAQINRYFVSKYQPDMIVAVAQFALDIISKSGLFNETDTTKQVIGVESHQKPEDKKYNEIEILYVGAISKHKGVQVLIKAFIRLAQANLRLHIVGKGPDLDEMEELARNDPRIIFHGFISDDALDSLRKQAHISIVPSIWYDMAQGVICESFAWGIPVIGSRIGGIPEFIKDGYNGHLFEPGDVAGLTSILEALLGDTTGLEKLSQGAFESSKQYDLDNHIRNLETTFGQLVHQYKSNQTTQSPG